MFGKVDYLRRYWLFSNFPFLFEFLSWKYIFPENLACTRLFFTIKDFLSMVLIYRLKSPLSFVWEIIFWGEKKFFCTLWLKIFSEKESLSSAGRKEVLSRIEINIFVIVILKALIINSFMVNFWYYNFSEPVLSKIYFKLNDNGNYFQDFFSTSKQDIV